MNKFYVQEPLPYGFDDLAPFMSQEQLSLHYQKHHLKYVENANNIFAQLEEMRKGNKEGDISATLKTLSFNIGGHILHSIFWKILAPQGQTGSPSEEFIKAIDSEYGSLDRFKQEFSQVAEKVEGSGWAALTYCKKTGRLLLLQIEKHNLFIYPTFAILMLLDVWEHSYYVDYRNDRKKFIDTFWQNVNWNEINKNFKDLI